ncbi:MAG: hypothetical protein CBB97_14790 [Candidatus Endolissoclinum sp. TMED37]|nr:MAG: hypothetical protein CBB97_14790 [Candidatus Endolissoclinum sp. TMED37]
MRILLIDGGYSTFYRFHATLQWWRKQEKPIDTCWEHFEFRNTLLKKYEKCISDLIKKLKIDKTIFCMDGKNSWRNQLIKDYKGGRTNGHQMMNVYLKDIREKIPNICDKLLIQYKISPGIEADDWIAYEILENNDPNNQYFIVSSDHDFYPLLNSQVSMVDMLGKSNVKENAVTGKLYLKQKLLMGDKSDNIPPIYKGCGEKTALKLAQNDIELEKTINKHPGAREQLELNRKLIEFGNWPTHIKQIMTNYVTHTAQS